MPRFSHFTQDNLADVQKILQKHLTAFEAETGIRITLGGVRFTGDEFRSKMTARIMSAGTAPATNPNDVYKDLLLSHGPLWAHKYIGKLFTGPDNKLYTLVGYHVPSTVRGKDKFVVSRNGKIFYAPLDYVRETKFLAKEA